MSYQANGSGYGHKPADIKIKRWYTPMTQLESILFFPHQVLFALLGMVGLAHYPRQIVRIRPRKPAIVASEAEAVGEEEVDLGRWVDRNVPSLLGTFTPSWWLPNGHLQTIYSVMGDFTKVDKVEYVRTYLRVPDGGTIGLDFTPPSHNDLPDSTPIVVVCHGLTGGSHESYVRNVLSRLIKPQNEGGLGVRGVVVNFRGCAGVPVTSSQLYSAGTTVDLTTALHYLRHTYPDAPLHGVGFSLGASVLARYMGESSGRCFLSSGVVLGCPWDLAAMSIKLENHFVTRHVYSTAMAQNLLRLFFGNYEQYRSAWRGVETEEWLARLKVLRKKRGVTLKGVDDVMVCKIGGPRAEGMWPFRDADEYYDWACPKKLLHGVKRPLLSINAFDDPIIDGAVLPIDEFQGSSHVFAAITGSGGHLGWFSGPFFSRTRSKERWIATPIREWLEAAIRDLPARQSITVARGRAPEYQVPAVNGHTNAGSDLDESWEWVEQGACPVMDQKRVGWRVLREGEIVIGAEGTGTMQGL